MSRVCEVENCERSHESKGYCALHASRMRKYGTPDGNLSTNGARPRLVELEALLAAYSMPVPEAGCHIWLRSTRGSGPRATTGCGYGYMSWQGRRRQAHILAYELAFGSVPEGVIVRHKCDTPPCINPAHLEVGTHRDNARDRDSRGRGLRGTRHHSVRLIEADVIEARRMRREEGASYPSIAARFGVNSGTAFQAVTGETWSHLPDPVPRHRAGRLGAQAPPDQQSNTDQLVRLSTTH